MSEHHHGHHQADNYQMEMDRWNKGRNVLAFVTLISVLACIGGYFTDPARFFRS